MLLRSDLPSVIVAAPRDGTVVRWRIQGASAVPGYSLDVLRANPAGTFTVTASTGSLTPAGVEIETSPTSLPIHAGEFIELNIPQQGQLSTLDGESTYETFFPTLAENETRESTNEFEYPFTFAFNADVELDPAPPKPPEPKQPAPGPPAPIVPPAIPSVTPSPTVAPAARCLVPGLIGKKLKAAKKKIRRGGCRVGTVARKSGATAKTAKVVHQGPKPGRSLAAGSKVNVKLG